VREITSAVLLAMGAALAPLRREGVLLFGSGGIVRDIHRLRWDDDETPEHVYEGFRYGSLSLRSFALAAP
jgi:aromatic ring-opening dioxygenase catalytic subunit (LigB family)